MKICIDGIFREMTDKENEEMKKQKLEDEKHYWQNVEYGEAINSEIRKKYSVSEEFSLLRQKDEKPDEYKDYYEYCENCKQFVKQQVEKYKEVEV